jgi:hypothetical protein
VLCRSGIDIEVREPVMSWLMKIPKARMHGSTAFMTWSLLFDKATWIACGGSTQMRRFRGTDVAFDLSPIIFFLDRGLR